MIIVYFSKSISRMSDNIKKLIIIVLKMISFLNYVLWFYKYIFYLHISFIYYKHYHDQNKYFFRMQIAI